MALTCPKCKSVFSGSSICPTCGHDLGPSGVGGWLLMLCIWLAIIGPTFSFAKLSELPASNMGFGVLLILGSIATGVLLWSGRYIGYRVAIVFFWTMLGLSGIALLAAPSEATITQAVARGITSGLSLAYLGCSKRVTNTYFRDGFRPTTKSRQSDFEAELRKLAKLREDGILTDEEFAAKKRRILQL